MPLPQQSRKTVILDTDLRRTLADQLGPARLATADRENELTHIAHTGGNVHVALIQVPYVLGDDRQPAALGPLRFVEAGADRVLASKGIQVRVERVDRGQPYRDSGQASLAVCKRLASAVRISVDQDELPIVLSGGCDVSKGILSGFDHSGCGVIWFDAHGDFNTPDTTVSGYLDGMSLAVVTGHSYRSWWAQIGNSSPVPDSAALLLGVRDLDEAEEENLRRSSVQVVKWCEGRPQSDVCASLDALARNVREIYLHIDMDSLDPVFAPGVMFDPVPGGLSLRDMEQTLHEIFTRFRVRAAALTVYTPERDRGDTTLNTGLRILQLVGEHGRAQVG